MHTYPGWSVGTETQPIRWADGKKNTSLYGAGFPLIAPRFFLPRFSQPHSQFIYFILCFTWSHHSGSLQLLEAVDPLTLQTLSLPPSGDVHSNSSAHCSSLVLSVLTALVY